MNRARAGPRRFHPRGMPRPHGSSYRRRGDGSVVVNHGAHTAAVLRGDRAERFLAEVERGDAQPVMTR